MPYDDPQNTHNPATGVTIPATWGDATRAAIQFLADDHPRCRAWNTTNIALTNGSWTKITLNSERFDAGGMHSTVTNTARMTVPTGEGGLYMFGGCVEITANNTATIIAARLIINGTTEVCRVGPHSTGNNTSALRLNPWALYELAAGDYVELEVFVNAASLNAVAVANYSPEVWITWLALVV